MDEIRLLPHVMETKSSMMQNWKEIASLAMNRVKKPIIMILACCSKKRIAWYFLCIASHSSVLDQCSL